MGAVGFEEGREGGEAGVGEVAAQGGVGRDEFYFVAGETDEGGEGVIVDRPLDGVVGVKAAAEFESGVGQVGGWAGEEVAEGLGVEAAGGDGSGVEGLAVEGEDGDAGFFGFVEIFLGARVGKALAQGEGFGACGGGNEERQGGGVEFVLLALFAGNVLGCAVLDQLVDGHSGVEWDRQRQGEEKEWEMAHGRSRFRRWSEVWRVSRRLRGRGRRNRAR